MASASRIKSTPAAWAELQRDIQYTKPTAAGAHIPPPSPLFFLVVQLRRDRIPRLEFGPPYRTAQITGRRIGPVTAPLNSLGNPAIRLEPPTPCEFIYSLTAVLGSPTPVFLDTHSTYPAFYCAMGSLCSKEVDNSPSNRPVRTLGSSAPRTAPVPPKKGQKIGGPARTLGGSTSEGTAATNAALAAERRASATAQKPKGALGKALNEQRKMTHVDTLKQVSEEERRRRETEAQSEIRNYN
ncbi:hypothetical protein MKZ38_008585 [Zalerion maritima]|uniref:Uncharacterized protein n=1 Tax=Zalerion maritima TaxID=339359 RepID=A0AAD5RYM1_9PEZI|nr:hypothetical protein MKZ38_008585 [Zalerion maritima]